MSAGGPEVRSLLIPSGGVRLLLPNAVVAEVSDYREPTPPEPGRPPWLAGSVAWRQQPLPLVDLAPLLGESGAPPRRRARIAVCNALSEQVAHPFLGLLSRGIPSLVRVDEAGLEPAAAPPGSEEVPALAWVRIQGEVALIPDLDQLQAALG